MLNSPLNTRPSFTRRLAPLSRPRARPTSEAAAKTLLSWSSGKDSTWALQELRRRNDVDLVGLFTTINASAQRIAMHAVRVELLRAQAVTLELPLRIIDLPYPCTNDVYEAKMTEFVEEVQAEGIEKVAFGDLFLQDVRQYREENMANTGIQTIFPIWGLPTRDLAHEMVASGVRAIVTCVDPKQLDRSFVGRDFDFAFLDELPAGVDPCGENGELHTFVWDAPCFRHPIDVEVGETVERDGFVFADVIPRRTTPATEGHL